MGNDGQINALQGDVTEMKGDVKALLGAVATIQGSLRNYDNELAHGERTFVELKSRLDKVEGSMVSIESCKERHGGNRWLVGTIIACASLVIACLALFTPAKAKGFAITPEVHTMELVQFVQENIARWSVIAVGILSVVGGIIRIAESLSPWMASRPDKVKWGIKALLSTLAGAVMWLFPGADMTWYVSVLVGFAAGVGLIGVDSGIAAGQRAMVRRRGVKITKDLETANAARRKAPRGFTKFGPMLVLLIIGLLAVGSVSCTAAQQQIQQGIWAQGGLGMSKCLLECGAPAVTTHINFNEVSVDTAGMTDDILSCLMTCTAKIGIPTIIASIASASSGRSMVCDARLVRMLVVTKRDGE